MRRPKILVTYKDKQTLEINKDKHTLERFWSDMASAKARRKNANRTSLAFILFDVQHLSVPHQPVAFAKTPYIFNIVYKLITIKTLSYVKMSSFIISYKLASSYPMLSHTFYIWFMNHEQIVIFFSFCNILLKYKWWNDNL